MNWVTGSDAVLVTSYKIIFYRDFLKTASLVSHPSPSLQNKSRSVPQEALHLREIALRRRTVQSCGTLRWSGRNKPPFVREISRRAGRLLPANLTLTN